MEHSVLGERQSFASSSQRNEGWMVRRLRVATLIKLTISSRGCRPEPVCRSRTPWLKGSSGLMEGGSVTKEYAYNARDCLQHRRPEFDPWVRKIPWRREQQPTPVFLPGKSHGQRSLKGYSSWSHKSPCLTTERVCSKISSSILPEEPLAIY